MGVAATGKRPGQPTHGTIYDRSRRRQEVRFEMVQRRLRDCCRVSVQAWVDQNVTFCFETTCNGYTSPRSRRTHFSSHSKLSSCSRRSHKLTWSISRKVILSQGGRHQVRLSRIRHRIGHWQTPRAANLRSLLRASICSDRDAVWMCTLTTQRSVYPCMLHPIESS